jgi:Ca2+-binding RTX toxin-like protein
VEEAVLVEGTPNADVLTGTDGNDQIYGRQGNDLLRGLAGNDWLDGGLGADRMVGGAGDDTYFVENVGDRAVETLGGLAGGVDLVRVSIDWRLGSNLENLRLHGPAIVGEGNGLDNLLAGNGNANRLYGYGGDDTLFGLTGNDRLFGGWGDDTFVWTPSVTVSSNAQYPTHIEADVFLNEPVLVDDGADLIFGESGSDTYVVPTFSFVFDFEVVHTIDNGVSANLATGIVDYIDTGFQRDRLFSIENIRTGNSTDRIIGSAAANVIESGGGYNVVRAGGGDDTIIGGVTRNSPSIDPTRTIMEVLDGGAGNDVIRSGGSFWENSGPGFIDFALTTDRLLGGGGNDRLIGGKGFVEMTGGTGADTFEARCDIFVVSNPTFGFTTDILASGATITDFNPGQGDRIELNVISTHLNDIYLPAPGPTPTFIGESPDIDVDEVGYSTVERSDGSVDTVVTYRFLATSPDDFAFAEKRDFRIVLEDYDGGLTDDLFAII